MEYVVKIDAYEGPLDMLLDLIKKNEFDIHDLPISQLTSQYIQQIETLKKEQIEVTSLFMDTASWLLLIKSRMCLPKTDDTDPRAALVNDLLDYQTYKNSVDKLKELKEIKEKFVKRQRSERIKQQRNSTIEELLATYTKILQRQSELEEQDRMNELLDQLKSHRYTIEGQMDYVLTSLQEEKKPLDELLLSLSNKDEIIVTFMAILELIRSDIQILLEGTTVYLALKHSGGEPHDSE